MMDLAWETWFDSQSEVCHKIEDLIDATCKGKSPAYRLAVHAAVLESISERMRNDIVLPDTDVGNPDV